MPAPKITSLLFIDTETTGLDPDKGERVIEVASARLDLATMEVRDAWSALVQGGDKIQGEYHTKACTFAGADWSAALPADRAMQALFSRMAGSTIAGQNVGFDMRFLRNEAKLLRLPFPKTQYHQIDTVPMSVPLLLTGRANSLSLEVTRTWAGCAGKQAHRALGDVLDTIAVFKKLAETFRIGLETIEAFGA